MIYGKGIAMSHGDSVVCIYGNEEYCDIVLDGREQDLLALIRKAFLDESTGGKFLRWVAADIIQEKFTHSDDHQKEHPQGE